MKRGLGFFVSGHPLDKYAEKLRNLTGVITTAEALERKPPERSWGRQPDPADEIQVAGMILGLRVQKSKRDQKLMPRPASKTHRKNRPHLLFARLRAPPRPVERIEAPGPGARRPHGDDDAASKISVSSIQALEDVEVKLPSGVRIRINLDRASEEMFAGLKSAADAAPGPGKVMLPTRKKANTQSSSSRRNERRRRSHLGRAHRRASRPKDASRPSAKGHSLQLKSIGFS